MNNPKRRQIPPEEIEELIKRIEGRLKIVSGGEAKELEKSISVLRTAWAGMRNGTVKIFQRIPLKIRGCSPQKVCLISRGDLLHPIFVVQSAEHLLSSYPTIRR